MNPLLSIIILTRNSMNVIQRLVAALERQDFSYPVEYIFMDNASTDGTREYLESLKLAPRRVEHVPIGEFSHSGTRMRAASLATGTMLAFFTDDIIPQGAGFLSALTLPVREGRAPAAYGVWQIDPGTSDPVDAWLHNGWYRDVIQLVEPVSRFCWDFFTPELRRRLCNFDNCASCIRRDLLLQVRFPDVPYGEDMLFAKRLVLGGHRIALAAEARFIHWHKVSFTYMMKRMCIDQYLSIPEFEIYYVRRKLGVIKAVTVRAIHRTWIAFIKVKMPFLRKFYWSAYNFKILCADFIGKYIGVLNEDSARGFSPINRRLLRLQKKIVKGIESRSILRY
ncbi:MAG: glycosyltransferase family 2 protein [Candidatus Aminicenantes bacterium]|nr:glycosyltransferase family 2 protein [Candidatus Aminicenantes bacterium]